MAWRPRRRRVTPAGLCRAEVRTLLREIIKLQRDWDEGKARQVRRAISLGHPDVIGAQNWLNSREAQSVLSDATWAHRKAQTWALAGILEALTGDEDRPAEIPRQATREEAA